MTYVSAIILLAMIAEANPAPLPIHCVERGASFNHAIEYCERA